MRLTHRFHRLRRSVLSVVVTLGMATALLLASGASANAACAVTDKLVPSQSFVLVASRSGGGYYQFQTTQVNRFPAVVTYINGQYANTYYVPVNFSANTVSVYLKNEYVSEIFNGVVRYVFKERTHVQACTQYWNVI